MPHFTWNIDAGNVVTWAIAIGGLCFRFGRIAQAIEQFQTSVEALKKEFGIHAEDDMQRFEGIQQTVNQILLRDRA